MATKPSGKAPSAAALRILVAMSEGKRLTQHRPLAWHFKGYPSYCFQTAANTYEYLKEDLHEDLQDFIQRGAFVPGIIGLDDAHVMELTDNGQAWAEWAKAERGGENNADE